VKASMLVALVLILAHLSSQKQYLLAEQAHRSSRPSDKLTQNGRDSPYTRVNPERPLHCSIDRSYQRTIQICAATLSRCEEYDKTAAGLSLIDNLENASSSLVRQCHTHLRFEVLNTERGFDKSLPGSTFSSAYVSDEFLTIGCTGVFYRAYAYDFGCRG
jgi:hypothetical protein